MSAERGSAQRFVLPPGSLAPENVDRSRARRDLHALERPLWDQEFVASDQLDPQLCHDHDTPSLDHDHVLIEVVRVHSGHAILATAPESDLAPVSTVEQITLDAFRELRRSSDAVQGFFMNSGKSFIDVLAVQRNRQGSQRAQHN
jgi:hypothetical protein